MNETLRIATVYRRDFFQSFLPCDMATTRWLRISENLAARGFKVDMIVNTSAGLVQKTPNLRFVPYSDVDWDRYDIIKTLFHKGFDSLCREGKHDHPFIISKLGSVVGNHDGVEGVHFFGRERDELFEVQKKINQKSRYITILTEPSRCLWEAEFGKKANLLLVPTGVDRKIPPPGSNPYGAGKEKIAVYIGNLYLSTQKDVNLLWQTKLNLLGTLLKKKGIKLCLVGPGDVSQIDPRAVTYLGPVDNGRIWDFQYFADAGIALAQGKIQQNESSKIYYYLRTGLPVVSEAPIPNNHLITEANLGFIAGYGDTHMMVDMIENAAHANWQKEGAIRYVLENHTWHRRVKVYETLIRREMGLCKSDPHKLVVTSFRGF